MVRGRGEGVGVVRARVGNRPSFNVTVLGSPSSKA